MQVTSTAVPLVPTHIGKCLLLSCEKRVFILGPSHHVRLSGCALSSLTKYRTPLYDLTVDQQGEW
ncbi:Protein MEMO1 [Portunus trituberculatus]|uniref:Protein MEMO1 n=1 Tax=Portunus trituberculatus TaxID=210409 RepID=A0A5B7KHU4_PORTR|nr:Protein MEMO1 [Portunus trituberculatus]